MASDLSKPALAKYSRVVLRSVSGAGTPVVGSAAIASILPGRNGSLCPPQRLMDMAVPMATRSDTAKVSKLVMTLPNHENRSGNLASDPFSNIGEPEKTH